MRYPFPWPHAMIFMRSDSQQPILYMDAAYHDEAGHPDKYVNLNFVNIS